MAYGRLLASQARGAFRDDHLRAEFLGLAECARRELLSRDPGGKAEVVFDAHAGAGLTAGRVRFDHQHVETFRRGIHRGAETGRTRADDHDVADVTLVDVDGLVEADAVGDLRVGRIPEDRFAAADHDRDVVRGDLPAIEDSCETSSRIEVEIGSRDARCATETPGPPAFAASTASPARRRLRSRDR